MRMQKQVRRCLKADQAADKEEKADKEEMLLLTLTTWMQG